MKQKNNVFNKFYFQRIFHIAFYQIFKNGAILINHDSFFERKDSLQLDSFQFLKINSLMAETIENNFSKQNFYKQIAEFDND